MKDIIQKNLDKVTLKILKKTIGTNTGGTKP